MLLRLSEGQVEAWRHSTCLLNIWSGAVSSGKTFAWILLMLAEIQDAPKKGDLVIMGYSTASVYRNIFELIDNDEAFKELRPFVQHNKGADFAFIFGRRVHIIGFSNIKAANRIQGMTIRKAFVDEGALMPEVVFKMLMTRMRVEGAQVFMTCNPASSNHYLRVDYILRAEETNTYYRLFTMADNPGLPEGYVEQQQRLYSGVFYRRFILGEWVAAEGAVYELWDDRTMVVDEYPDIVEVVAVGIDYGTNHPTAGHALSLCADGRLYVTHEWAPNVDSAGQHRRLTDSQLADSLQLWLADLPQKPTVIYADPAAASFHQELRHRGVRTAKAKNAVVDGIRTVDSLLVAGQLKVHKECVQLIDEIPNYRWDENASERGEDKPIKERDDYVDALRYSVFSSRHLWRNRVTQPEDIAA